LTGCFQSTALLGPGITLVSTGNVTQAGLQYGANEVIKKETGKDTFGLIKEKVNEKSNKRKFEAKFRNFLENRIEVSRKKLSLN